jgi:ribosomal protein S18 acetylase RimI-like enzyme
LTCHHIAENNCKTDISFLRIFFNTSNFHLITYTKIERSEYFTGAKYNYLIDKKNDNFVNTNKLIIKELDESYLLTIKNMLGENDDQVKSVENNCSHNVLFQASLFLENKTQNEQHVYALFINNEIASLCNIYLLLNHLISEKYYVVGIYTKEKYRRLGYAFKLLSYCCIKFIESDTCFIYNVDHDNTASQALVKKLNMELLGISYFYVID